MSHVQRNRRSLHQEEMSIWTVVKCLKIFWIRFELQMKRPVPVLLRFARIAHSRTPIPVQTVMFVACHYRKLSETKL